MKRVVSILLLFTILTASMGVQFIFTLRTRQIRSEMKQYLKSTVPEDELHTFYFHDDQEPDWVREGKEFQLDGQFYDVVEVTTYDDQVRYKCINDVEETALFAGLGQLVMGHLNKDGTTSRGLHSLAFLNLFLSPNSVNGLHMPLPDQNKNSIPYCFSIQKWHLSILSPPPNLVS